jgi:hypothetical protein
VQAGDHNLQLNHFQYTARPLPVSVDDLLRWRPTRQRALAKLAENPDDAAANACFRQMLSPESLWDRSQVRFICTDSPLITRISARADDRGRVIIKRSGPVQAGSRNTQHNHFRFRVEPPRNAFEAMLRRNPALVRTLAVLARHPADRAVQRFFHAQLTDAYRLPSHMIRRISVPARDATRVAVQYGRGVQYGRHNVRRDRIEIASPEITPVRPFSHSRLARLTPPTRVARDPRPSKRPRL